MLLVSCTGFSSFKNCNLYVVTLYISLIKISFYELTDCKFCSLDGNMFYYLLLLRWFMFKFMFRITTTFKPQSDSLQYCTTNMKLQCFFFLSNNLFENLKYVIFIDTDNISPLFSFNKNSSVSLNVLEIMINIIKVQSIKYNIIL